ncbi:MAG: DUF2480 family protein [Chlorobiales bacterium]|nr:DUF2480 family protein [Chlorobiales bacterium]
MYETPVLLEFDMQDFLTNGILKEKDFREKLETHDWSQYDNKKVMIKGCGSTPIPTWAYMIVTAYMVPHAEKIMYGEPCASVPIYRKENKIYAH